MPDALSKTIPIWVCVMNRVLFPPDDPSSLASGFENDPHLALYTPPTAVSRSEHAQIESLIPQFSDQLRALRLDLHALRAKLGGKPMRCVWVTPDSKLPEEPETSSPTPSSVLSSSLLLPELSQESISQTRKPRRIFGDNAHAVVLVTASLRVTGGEMGGLASSVASRGQTFTYIQGAADDTENWACGLTAPLWWAWHDRLLAAATSSRESEIKSLVDSIVQKDAQRKHEEQRSVAWLPQAMCKGCKWEAHAIQVAPWIWIVEGAVAPSLIHFVSSKRDSESTSNTRDSTLTCLIALSTDGATDPATWRRSPFSVIAGLGKQRKSAGRNLRKALPMLCDIVADWVKATVPQQLTQHEGENGENEGREVADHKNKQGDQKRQTGILLACPTGTDLSVGVALALHCFLLDDDETIRLTMLPQPQSQPQSLSQVGAQPPCISPLPPSSLSHNSIFTKSDIQVRMGKIVARMPSANPSRATLQSVNSFLMD